MLLKSEYFCADQNLVWNLNNKPSKWQTTNTFTLGWYWNHVCYVSGNCMHSIHASVAWNCIALWRFTHPTDSHAQTDRLLRSMFRYAMTDCKTICLHLLWIHFNSHWAPVSVDHSQGVVDSWFRSPVNPYFKVITSIPAYRRLSYCPHSN